MILQCIHIEKKDEKFQTNLLQAKRGMVQIFNEKKAAKVHS